MNFTAFLEVICRRLLGELAWDIASEFPLIPRRQTRHIRQSTLLCLWPVDIQRKIQNFKLANQKSISPLFPKKQTPINMDWFHKCCENTTALFETVPFALCPLSQNHRFHNIMQPFGNLLFLPQHLVMSVMVTRRSLMTRSVSICLHNS